MTSADDSILKVEQVYKKFTRTLKRSMFYGTSDLLWDMIGFPKDRTQLRPSEYWALRDVNFSLSRGETLGIIGRNGAGKSTVLRLIAGIYPPDAGKITVKGRVGALIALGAGFHPHLSGRENVYLNGTILGMSRSEIDRNFDSIVEFSELDKFIDAPISTYSSGMNVRLGFSIAVHSTPSLLIVDEVLAVGDLAFALKCYRKMEDYRKQGGSTLLVSHSNQLIRNVCKRAIWLDHGEIKMDGNVHEVCDAYEAAVLGGVSSSGRGRKLDYDPEVNIEKVETVGGDGQVRSDFGVATPLILRIHVHCKRTIKAPIFSVSMEDAEARVVASNFTHLDNQPIESLDAGFHEIEYKIPALALKRGKYWVSLTLAESEINSILSWHEAIVEFSVTSGPVSYGIHNPFPQWSVKSSVLELHESSKDAAP